VCGALTGNQESKDGLQVASVLAQDAICYSTVVRFACFVILFFDFKGSEFCSAKFFLSKLDIMQTKKK
jgi:hypothetical protein